MAKSILIIICAFLFICLQVNQTQADIKKLTKDKDQLKSTGRFFFGSHKGASALASQAGVYSLFNRPISDLNLYNGAAAAAAAAAGYQAQAFIPSVAHIQHIPIEPPQLASAYYYQSNYPPAANKESAEIYYNVPATAFRKKNYFHGNQNYYYHAPL